VSSVGTMTAGSLALWTWSAGEGQPLVYLHGYEQHPGAAHFLEELSRTRAVLAPEHPGYGTSSGLDTVVDVFDIVLSYRALLQDWGRGPVDLVGHSLGGMFAAELAVFCPDLVRKLVLVDSYGLWIDDLPCIDPFATGDTALVAAKWHNPALAPTEPSNFVPDQDDPHSAVVFRAQNLAAATKFMWPFPDRGLRRRLGFISVPTLVIHGESDGLVPLAYGEEFARLIPHARFVPIAGAGHLPMIEREDAFLSAVGAFLAPHDASGVEE